MLRRGYLALILLLCVFTYVNFGIQLTKSETQIYWALLALPLLVTESFKIDSNVFILNIIAVIGTLLAFMGTNLLIEQKHVYPVVNLVCASLLYSYLNRLQDYGKTIETLYMSTGLATITVQILQMIGLVSLNLPFVARSDEYYELYAHLATGRGTIGFATESHTVNEAFVGLFTLITFTYGWSSNKIKILAQLILYTIFLLSKSAVWAPFFILYLLFNKINRSRVFNIILVMLLSLIAVAAVSVAAVSIDSLGRIYYVLNTILSMDISLENFLVHFNRGGLYRVMPIISPFYTQCTFVACETISALDGSVYSVGYPGFFGLFSIWNTPVTIIPMSIIFFICLFHNRQILLRNIETVFLACGIIFLSSVNSPWLMLTLLAIIWKKKHERSDHRNVS